MTSPAPDTSKSAAANDATPTAEFVAKSPLMVTVLLVTVVEMPLEPRKLRSESAILTTSVPVSPAISIVLAPAIKSTYSLVVRELVPKPVLSL